MNMRTLSLAALTVLDVPPPEQVRIAAQTGFTHVGLRLLPATPTDPDYAMLGDTPAAFATSFSVAMRHRLIRHRERSSISPVAGWNHHPRCAAALLMPL